MLLPKVEGASQWKDFRPISLCNVSSKIISKILANRLNKLLPRLISPWQTGFVPGRGIADNIMVAQELVMDLDRRLRHPNIILKLDMEKAYDRVEWPFLLFMLRAFGFSEWVVDLLFRTFANSWFSVLINGEPSGFFKSTRGVRQGDPLSPALFLFAAEFLGRGLQHLCMEDECRYYVAAGLRVPYLAFADDTIVFSRCSEDCLRSLKEFLDYYQLVSGQKVNSAKSSIMCSNRLSSNQIALVSDILGFRQQDFPITYLGAPLVRGRINSAAFDGVLAKVRKRLFHWSSKLLSMGGKIILIRHVLSSIPIYLLQVLQPPKAVLIALGRLCNAFLWDHKLNDKRVHWSAWERLCFPQEEGGLGFRSFADVTKAFSCKLWWRLRKNDSMWANFMHAKYIKGCHPLLVELERPLASWRRLVAVRSLAESNIRWSLGEGLVDFWYDRWCSDIPLAFQLGIVDPPHFLVAEFFSSDGWNVQRLRQWLPPDLVLQVTQVVFDPDQKDCLVWLPSSTGEFSTASAWEDLREKRNVSLVDRLIWCPLVPLKISFFVWRLVRGFLPLDSQLRRRGLSIVSRCDCCLTSEESIVHLFVTGPVAANVWNHYAQRFGIMNFSFMGVSSMLLGWYNSHRRVSVEHVRVVVPLLILWFIWRERNSSRFEGLLMRSQHVVYQVDSLLDQLGRAGCFRQVHFRGDKDCALSSFARRIHVRHRVMAVHWEKPMFGTLKLKTDASVCQGRG